MILMFLPFITTTLIVRSESVWTRLTSKPSIPSDLQELLDSLYMTGYMPEYILPEDELTETEKTEGEYLDFPDLKNAQDDVFVPPESEYSKNSLHFKNIKGHKRLISDKSWSEEEPRDGLWSPYIGPDDLRLDLIAHLTENFTGKDMGQNGSTKLDFLIPIPEKGTYSPIGASTVLHKIPSTEQPMFVNNNLPLTLKQSFSIAYITPPKQSQPAHTEFQNMFTVKHSQPQTTQLQDMFTINHSQPQATSTPKTFFQQVKQPKTDLVMKDLQPLLSMKISQFPLTEKQPQATMITKLQEQQLASTAQQPQPQFVLTGLQQQPVFIGQQQPILGGQQQQPVLLGQHHILIGPHQHFLIGHQSVTAGQQPPSGLSGQQYRIFFKQPESASLQTKTEQPLHSLAKNPAHAEQHKTSKKPITGNKRIEAKAVSLWVNTPHSGEVELGINQNTSLKDDIPLNNRTISNTEINVDSQSNLSSYRPAIQNHAVQEIENTHLLKSINVTAKPKKKKFTFLNIFKKNKKPLTPPPRNISLQANSLADLYNQLTETNMVDLYNELEKESSILQQHENEQSSNQKRKKK